MICTSTPSTAATGPSRGGSYDTNGNHPANIRPGAAGLPCSSDDEIWGFNDGEVSFGNMPIDFDLEVSRRATVHSLYPDPRHHSAVVIQAAVRGFVCRKRTMRLMRDRERAAVIIQTRWRDRRAHEAKSPTESGDLPPSPVSPKAFKDSAVRLLQDRTNSLHLNYCDVPASPPAMTFTRTVPVEAMVPVASDRLEGPGLSAKREILNMVKNKRMELERKLERNRRQSAATSTLPPAITGMSATPSLTSTSTPTTHLPALAASLTGRRQSSRLRQAPGTAPTTLTTRSSSSVTTLVTPRHSNTTGSLAPPRRRSINVRLSTARDSTRASSAAEVAKRSRETRWNTEKNSTTSFDSSEAGGIEYSPPLHQRKASRTGVVFPAELKHPSPMRVSTPTPPAHWQPPSVLSQYRSGATT